jgi:hypothetical protein
MKKKTWLIDIMIEKRFADGGILVIYNQVWVTGLEIDISRVNRREISVDGNRVSFGGTIHFIKEIGSDIDGGNFLYKMNLS